MGAGKVVCMLTTLQGSSPIAAFLDSLAQTVACYPPAPNVSTRCDRHAQNKFTADCLANIWAVDVSSASHCT
eukprot:6116345-Amphidinium_carterae.1